MSVFRSIVLASLNEPIAVVIETSTPNLTTAPQQRVGEYFGAFVSLPASTLIRLLRGRHLSAGHHASCSARQDPHSAPIDVAAQSNHT
jgi:hypothetical protein